MLTVAKLREALSELDGSLPILVIDTRSGVVDEPSCHGSVYKFSESDGNYGVDLPIDTMYVPIYLG